MYRDLKELILLGLSSIFILIIPFTLFFLGAKVLSQGSLNSKGTVTSISKGLLNTCVEVSKTTQGESAIIDFCNLKSWMLGDEVSNGDYISISIDRNALSPNTMTLTKIKK